MLNFNQASLASTSTQSVTNQNNIENLQYEVTHTDDEQPATIMNMDIDAGRSTCNNESHESRTPSTQLRLPQRFRDFLLIRL